MKTPPKNANSFGDREIVINNNKSRKRKRKKKNVEMRKNEIEETLYFRVSLN